MAKKALLTIDGTHRKVKDQFITIDNIYHKIKKAYITVGGVYRPLMSSEPEYWGQTNERLSIARGGKVGCVSTPDYAWFAGGKANLDTIIGLTHINPDGSEEYGPICYSDATAKVDVYDKNLTRFIPDALSDSPYTYNGYNPASTSFGKYVLFSNSQHQETDSLNTLTFGDQMFYDPVIHVYDNELTKYAREWYNDTHICGYQVSATSTETYALIAGGMYEDFSYDFEINDYVYYNIEFSDVSVIDTELIRTHTALSHKNYNMSSTSLNQYAIFAGGHYNFTDAFDTSTSNLTRISLEAPNSYKQKMPSATIGNHAVFCDTYGFITYDNELVKTYNTYPSEAGTAMASVILNDHLLCYGIRGNTQVTKKCMYIYDANLTLVKTILRDISEGDTGYSDSMAAVGSYALVAGAGEGHYSDMVEVFTV